MHIIRKAPGCFLGAFTISPMKELAIIRLFLATGKKQKSTGVSHVQINVTSESGVHALVIHT